MVFGLLDAGDYGGHINVYLAKISKKFGTQDNGEASFDRS